MSKVKATKPAMRTKSVARGLGFAPCTLAIAISGALCATAVTAEEVNIALDKLKIQETITPDTNPYAVPGAPYLAKSLSDSRRTRSLAETPQTITVLTAAEIIDSGRTDLSEILDAQPGITLGTGENGNAFGDRYIIRGHEARSDIFVDGLRDPGMTIRESFATEQIEISKGPSSTFAGRGTTGGAVNSATKRASTEFDFSKLSATIGTDNQARVSLDTNHVISFDTAIRANFVLSQEDVPDRAPADRERKGLAVSVTHQPSDDLEITADIYHFQGDDKPDLGTYIDRNNDYTIVEDVPAYTQKGDFLKSKVSTATLRVGYELNPDTKIVNLTRYGTTDNGYFIHGLGGTTAYATEADAIAGTNGYSSMALDNPHQGWQEVNYFANQTNLITQQEIGGLNHEIVAGLEYSNQRVLNGTYANTAGGTTNCWTNGRGGVGASYCVLDAAGNEVANLNNLSQRTVTKSNFDSDWNVEAVSLSLMDTVDFDEKWTAFAGVRYDYYDYSNKVYNGREDTTKTYSDKDGLFNGHLGASYKMTPKANVYASISTATNLNGGESDVGTSCGYGGICLEGEDVSLGNPERTTSLEIGTKWRFNEDKMLATAAVFRTVKSDVFEQARGTSYDIAGSSNTGENTVQGIELGLTGNLTDKLSGHLGYTMMSGKVTDSYDANNIGKILGNFAEKSMSVQLKYQATPKLAIGGGATYESERFAGQPDSAASDTLEVPSYTVFDAFASYQVNRDVKVRLNVTNLFDTNYYLAAYRSGTFTYIGDARNLQLSVDYSF